MSDLEDKLVEHVEAIESLCTQAGDRDPSIKEALSGPLETALDALDAVQDVLSDVADEAASEAQGTGE